MARYKIFPVADAHCDSLNENVLVAETDNAGEAKSLAREHSTFTYGTGILDSTTGLIDVGFGFGILCSTGDDYNG